MAVQQIKLVKNILVGNDQLAHHNRQRFHSAGVLAINVMASPGAGKTSLIIRTMEQLGGQPRVGVIEGDIAGRIDADKVMAAGAADVVQINTGGNCHLEANMIQTALDHFNLDELDIVLVENVGNLVCPTHWSLGEDLRICLLSTPEGHDKPVKYPEIFATSEVIIINKVDLMQMVDFDRDFFYEALKALNPNAITFEVSCRTGEGLASWTDWLLAHLAGLRISHQTSQP